MTRTITRSDVTYALGYTPYADTNTADYQTADQVKGALPSLADGTLDLKALSTDARITAADQLRVTGNFGGTLPAASAGGKTANGLIGWNLQNGSAEVDFVNMFTAPGRSFSWWQKQASGPPTRLLDLMPDGALLPQKLKVGGQGWLEAIIGATEVNSRFVSLATDGGSAGVFGTRASDNNNVDSQGGWAIGGFAINDNAAARRAVYGMYIESRRNAGAGTTQNVETALVNRGDCVPRSPFTALANGDTIGWLIGLSRLDVTDSGDCTVGIYLGGGNIDGATGLPRTPDPRWKTGIIFGATSVRDGGNDGYPYAMAIDMPRHYSYVWRNATDGLPVSWIRSDATAANQGGELVFTDTGVLLASHASAARFQIAGTTLTATGTLVVAGGSSFQDVANFPAGLGVNVPIYANDAAAAAGGLPINRVYRNGSVLMMRVA